MTMTAREALDATTNVRAAMSALSVYLEHERPAPRAVWSRLFDLGLARVDFPVGRGGLGAAPHLQRDVDGLTRSYGIPLVHTANAAGVSVVAPALMAFGRADQQARFLRRIFTAEETWCQLFSEPGAGSDLAALASGVQRVGDGWVLNGQKVWTTMAHISDWGLLLARSSDTRHRGITCFVLDMSSPGIEVRPLRQMTGDAEFNEVFFTDVLIPDNCRLGEIDDGWTVTRTILANERASASADVEARGPAIERALTMWRATPVPDRRVQHRERLIACWIRARLAGLLSARARAVAGPPGPEFALAKLLMSETNVDIHELCVEMIGAAGMLVRSYAMVIPDSWDAVGAESDDTVTGFLRSRANTIEGGTAEVQRNVVAERVLGLPRG